MFIDGFFTFFAPNGELSEKVSLSDVELERIDGGGLALVHSDLRYKVEFHPGVECPIAQFIERGGKLLYSLPPIEDTEELARLGMVFIPQTSSFSRVYVAREFAKPGTVDFLPLLRRMDFFEVKSVWVESKLFPNDPSPEDFGGIFARYATELMSEVESISFAESVSSYFNVMESDLMSAYLVAEEASLKLSSTPLRIHWRQDPSGTTLSEISVLPFETLANEPLWEPTAGPYAVSQLDVLTMYNFASILKSFYHHDPARFTDIREVLCN